MLGSCSHADATNFGSTPDASRASTTLRGVFEWESHAYRMNMLMTEVDSRSPCLTIRRCDMTVSITRGDYFDRVPTGARFEVKSLKPDSLSGVMIEFVEMGVSE